MNKLLVFIIIAVVGLGMIRITTMMGLSDSYAIKQSKQVPPEKTTVQPERQSQQPSEAPRATTVRPPERQSQFSPEQQEDSRLFPSTTSFDHHHHHHHQDYCHLLLS